MFKDYWVCVISTSTRLTQHKMRPIWYRKNCQIKWNKIRFIHTNWKEETLKKQKREKEKRRRKTFNQNLRKRFFSVGLQHNYSLSVSSFEHGFRCFVRREVIFVAVRIDRVFKKHQVHHRRHQHHSHPSNGATSTKYCKIFVKRINVKAEIYSFILAECVSNLNYARLFILDIIFFVVSCVRHSGCLRLYRLGARIDVCVEQDSCHCVRLWFCVFFFRCCFWCFRAYYTRRDTAEEK